MKSVRLFTRCTRSLSVRPSAPHTVRTNARKLAPVSFRSLTTTQFRPKGIYPDSSDPKPPKTQPSSSSPANAEPSALSESDYHELSDKYLDTLVLSLEDKAEASEGVEVEYSAGVLTITHNIKGTYVINKQPPNKQIWLSSPVSGPKRYDWVLTGAGQHEKEGSEYGGSDDGQGGRWVYLRDGSSLTDLLKQELDVTVAGEDRGAGRQAPGGSAKLEGE